MNRGLLMIALIFVSLAYCKHIDETEAQNRCPLLMRRKQAVA